MSLHIEFCLDEIDCEIEAALDNALDDIDRVSLQRHVAGMRAIIAFARMRSAAEQSVRTHEEDDLTLVKGIGDAERKILNGLGVRTFSAIATWRLDDVEPLEKHGITLDRIACENWIEQAALLATGAKTLYALSMLQHNGGGVAGSQHAAADDAKGDDRSDAHSELATDISLSHPVDGNDCATPADVVEMPEGSLATAPLITPAVPTADIVHLEPAKKVWRGPVQRRELRVAAAATAAILAVIGIGLAAERQLASYHATLVSSLALPFETMP